MTLADLLNQLNITTKEQSIKEQYQQQILEVFNKFQSEVQQQYDKALNNYKKLQEEWSDEPEVAKQLLLNDLKQKRIKYSKFLSTGNKFINEFNLLNYNTEEELMTFIEDWLSAIDDYNEIRTAMETINNEADNKIRTIQEAKVAQQVEEMNKNLDGETTEEEEEEEEESSSTGLIGKKDTTLIK